MKFHYYLDKKENKKKEHQVRFTMAMRGVRMVGSIGYNVPLAMWDANKKQFKKGPVNSDGLDQSVIMSRLTDIQAHFNNLELRTTERFTMEQLREELAKAIAKNEAKMAAINSGSSEEVIEQKEAEAEKILPKRKVKSAVDYIDEFMREESRLKEWSPETVRMIKSFKNHLLKFNKKADLDYFDKNGLNKFITYLRSDAGLEENSAKKQYKNLSWFLRWAARKGYTQVRDVDSYVPVFKTVKKPVIFLTPEELSKVYHLKIPKNGEVVKLMTYEGREYEKVVAESGGMERARDLFCFCAFTGLRYSDVVEVRRVDINDGVLTVTTQKTHDRLPIILHENALAILKKYEKEEFRGGRALPYMTNQQMNRCLKDLCEICGFNTPYTVTCYRRGTRHDEVYPKYELIGTHAGRKTFICFALSNGVAPDVVMKFTGHSDYKSMKPYIDITEDAKKEAIRKMEAAFKK